MMEVFNYPAQSEWQSILRRPSGGDEDKQTLVKTILEAVNAGGDRAVGKFNAQWGGYAGPDWLVDLELINRSEQLISRDLKEAMLVASDNLRTFHAAQKEEIKYIETTPGVVCWRKSIPIQRVGLYIPGGSAPLFSTLLMLGIPAQLAGCQEIVVCTPTDPKGEVHPAILFATKLSGIKTIYKAGGAQAIGALAFGTETIAPVNKIFGPGNSYVTQAKSMVQQYGVAIDMPAGPSEVAILADATCPPAFIAADLLAQAEHGPDSQVVLVTTSEALIAAVIIEIEKQVSLLPRANVAKEALKNSKAIRVRTAQEGIDLINAYAPEHLILALENPEKWGEKVINAGSVFLGIYTPESAGDYASGTNHTLPTGGYARAYSGVSLDSFYKKVTFQQISPAGLQNLGPTIKTLAHAEGLAGHASSVSIRLDKLKS